MMWLVDRICSWQIVILAVIQWVLVHSMIHLNTGWLPGALNLSDLGNQRFSSAQWVKCRWWWCASSLTVDFSRDLANFKAFRPASWRIHLNMFEAKPWLFISRLSLVFKYFLLRAFDCQSAVFNGWITMRVWQLQRFTITYRYKMTEIWQFRLHTRLMT